MGCESLPACSRAQREPTLESRSVIFTLDLPPTQDAIVANEGLGWDPHYYTYNNPGGDDGILGRGDNPIYTNLHPQNSLSPHDDESLAKKGLYLGTVDGNQKSGLTTWDGAKTRDSKLGGSSQDGRKWLIYNPYLQAMKRPFIRGLTTY